MASDGFFRKFVCRPAPDALAAFPVFAKKTVQLEPEKWCSRTGIPEEKS
jgi:hypothetical protein